MPRYPLNSPCILILCIAAQLGFETRAENWPGFRGGAGQGRSNETQVPLHWSAEENVAWQTDVPGQGWSSPIVWGDRVFVTTATNDGRECRVLCLDAHSGDMLWNRLVYEQTPQRKEGKNSYATPTPVTDGEWVYAVFGDGGVAALDFEGEIQWINREVDFYSRHGLGASPLLHDGLLVMPYDGSNRVDQAESYPQVTDDERLGWQLPWDKSFIIAMDAKTGERVWKAKRGMSRIAHVTPLVLEVDGRTQIVSTAGDVIQGFDPADGTLLWTVRTQGEGVTPSPVYGAGLLYASSGFEATTFRGVRPGGSGDVTETNIVWEEIKGCPKQSSPLFAAPHVYAITDNGVATCYDAASGEIVNQVRIDGNHCASPTYAAGRIYFLSEEGRLHRRLRDARDDHPRPQRPQRALPSLASRRRRPHLY